MVLGNHGLATVGRDDLVNEIIQPSKISHEPWPQRGEELAIGL